MEYLPLYSFLSVAAIAVFSFVSVAVWSQNRRREREAFYRHEILKRLAEMQGTGSEQVIQVMQEEERRERRSSQERLKVGGLAAAGCGAGLITFLWGVERVRLAGAIPLLVGLGLLVYVYMLAPKDRP
jgi:hypothetical protein